MTIHAKPLYKFLAAFGLIATLAACGSGGDDNKDFTPAPFTIPAVTDAAVSTEVISSPVPLTDFNQDVDISITNGSYSVAGGPYTKDKGTISSGKSVTVKVITSASTNTSVEAVLTVGGVSNSFKVTTLLNVIPKLSSFTPATGVVPKSENTSNEITVQDIDKAVDITVVGGKYAIGSGEFTDAKGTVSKGQTVKLRGVAASTTDTSSKVSVTIGIEGKGAVTREYAIATLKDTVAPNAQILFPPPVSMTEGNTILVRGSASDDYNTVASVKVNGVAVTPKAAGDFSTWQVTVPLTASTDNDLIVTTEDSAGNKSSTQSQPAAKVMVRQGDRNNAFPDDDVKSSYQQGLVIDKFNGRNRLLVAQSTPDRIVAVDLATGKRSVFADSVYTQCTPVLEPGTQRLYGCRGFKLIYVDLADASKHDAVTFSFGNVAALALDSSLSVPKIFGVDQLENVFFSHNVSSSTYSVLSDAATLVPNADNPFMRAQGIAYDKQNSRYLVANGGPVKDMAQHAILTVDKISGARTILSSNTVGEGDPFSGLLPAPSTNYNSLASIAIDEKNNRAIVGEAVFGKLFFVDLVSGKRKLFSDSSSADSVNPINYILNVTLDESGNYIFVSDFYQNGIYAVDLVTGQRVIFSRSASGD